MVDLAAAYRRLDEMLKEHGYDDAAYLVRIDIWNHRRPLGGPAVHFMLSAHIERGEPRGIIQVEAPTLDAAFAQMGAALTRSTHELDDIREVKLPGEADAEMAPAAPLSRLIEDDEPF